MNSTYDKQVVYLSLALISSMSCNGHSRKAVYFTKGFAINLFFDAY